MCSISISAIIAVLLVIFRECQVQGALIPTRFLGPRETITSNDSSISTQLKRRDITPEERQRLDGLYDYYKGIYFEVAYPGEGDGSCTIEQFNILAEATRMAIQLADFSGGDIYKEDPATHRFFVRNSKAPEGGRWTSLPYATSYVHLHHNLFQPSRFPVSGNGGSIAKRITYRCGDMDFIPPSTAGCAGGKVVAYTMQGTVTLTGTTTVFCDKFFEEGKYLNEIIDGPPKTINDFGDPKLISYEQMIVHEWMHADIMGYKQHIGDILDSTSTDDSTKYKIYGMSRCRDYAWKYMRDPCCPHVNPGTVWNADNYAWYFANKYYARKWGWTDDGSPPTNLDLKADSGSIGSPGETLVDGSSITVPPIPENCYPLPPLDSTSGTITCDFDPPAPDSSPSGTCNCNESGCTADSPVCCANGTCTPEPPPVCNCNESGCTADSPACCANGTC